jgi:hypothetical protein
LLLRAILRRHAPSYLYPLLALGQYLPHRFPAFNSFGSFFIPLLYATLHGMAWRWYVNCSLLPSFKTLYSIYVPVLYHHCTPKLIARQNCMHYSSCLLLYIVVVVVKERKSSCNANEKEVIKIVAEYKRSKYTCSD